MAPAILWDDPTFDVTSLPKNDLSPTARGRSHRTGLFHWPATPQGTSTSRAIKRVFDIAFATVALILTLPFYPIIMLAILLEDGRPFFGQRRETLGGREFVCWKFRSMCRGAERCKRKFPIVMWRTVPNYSSRETPVSRVSDYCFEPFNRRIASHFFNVLRGDMSVVGPRPLSFDENQWCPAWRLD